LFKLNKTSGIILGASKCLKTYKNYQLIKIIIQFLYNAYPILLQYLSNTCRIYLLNTCTILIQHKYLFNNYPNIIQYCMFTWHMNRLCWNIYFVGWTKNLCGPDFAYSQVSFSSTFYARLFCTKVFLTAFL